MSYKTREAWLNAFAKAACPMFKKMGSPLPGNIRVSIGFTSKGARGKAIGQCFADTCSADGQYEIFVSPQLPDSSRIADILTHELVHAAVGLHEKHGKKFARLASALGLEGKMTATVAGDFWHSWADKIIAKLGPIPHAELSSTTVTTEKKQTTRLIKCECPECGFVFRAAASWLECGELRCPDASCEGVIEVEVKP